MNTNLDNILMQLRKCVQHPYLIAPDLGDWEGEGDVGEGEGLPRLIMASGKLILLQTLLRKLRDKGHRVVLFSQFVINLDMVASLIEGEGYKYLRLDGQQGQDQRQKAIDAFHDARSDYFIYLISTRAGGIGINLASADCVIVFDPDCNPHVDLQAISRVHRIGQRRKVLVFRLRGKMTAEEEIVQVARKKLVLDHVVVQNESSRPEEMERILKFGVGAESFLCGRRS